MRRRQREEEVFEVVHVAAWKVLAKFGFYTIIAPAVLGVSLHGFANGIFRIEEYIGHRIGEAADAVAQAAGYQLPDELERAQTLDDVIDIEATQHDLHPDLIRAIIKQESRGNQWAESHAGAMGLMQLMPDTVKACIKAGIIKDSGAAYDDKQNVKCGTWWLKHSMREQKEHLNRALQNYNGGPKCIDRCEESIDYAKKVTNYFVTRNFDLKKSRNG